MRILLVTQNFPPETGAVANRLNELSVRLMDKGARITVLAPMPSYPFMEVFDEYKGKWFVRETIGDLEVLRTYIFARGRGGIPYRIVNYLSYTLTSLIAGVASRRRFDCVFLDAPPLFLGISAWAIHAIKRTRFVVNMSDLWPESAERLGLVKSRLLLSWARSLEEFLYRHADLITAQTQGIVESISTRMPHKKVLWLKNGVDLSFYDHTSVESSWRREHGYAEEDFMVLFAGLIGHAQGCEVIVEAARELADQPRLKFCFFGDGPEKAKCVALAESYGLSSVAFYPVQPKSEMPGIIAAADASVIPLKKLDLFRGAIPSKIFEHLAMRKPILLGVEGEAKSLFIDDADAGLAYEPENPRELAAAIRTLYSDGRLCAKLGANGLAYVREHFNRDRIADELWQCLVDERPARAGDD